MASRRRPFTRYPGGPSGAVAPGPNQTAPEGVLAHRSPRLAAVLATAVVLALVLAVPVAAVPASAASPAPAPASPGPASAPGSSPLLSPATSVPFDPTAVTADQPLAAPLAGDLARQAAQAAQAEADRAAVAYRQAQADQARRATALAAADRQDQAAAARLATADKADQQAAAQLARARQNLRDLAVADYVTGGTAATVDYVLSSSDANDLSRRQWLVRSVLDSHQAQDLRLVAADQAAAHQLDAAQSDMGRAVAAKETAAEALANAAAVVQQRAADLQARRALLDLSLAAAPVGDSDIPRMFVDAYVRAAATMAVQRPACRVPWTLLAAIGEVESHQGRSNGGSLLVGGDVLPPILGPVLDGTNGTALIADTDHGVWDGNTTYDRAVGPMQFLPSTWARVGRDGNGDGVADPDNIYDAALSAAFYLCMAVPTGGLDTDPAQRVAVFSYNHSSAYVDGVLGWYQAYQSDPTLTGGLSGVSSTNR